MMKKEHQTKWKHFAFIPEGLPPDSKGIRYGDSGFISLCKEWQAGRNPRGYRVLNTKFKSGMEGRSITTDWTGFDKAAAEEEAKHPTKPSIFWSDGYIGEARQDFLRRQMLWSVIRSYHSAGDLASDILTLLSLGRDDEFHSFIASIRFRKPMIVFLQPYPPADGVPRD